MAGYMDIFNKGPLAPSTTIKDDRMPQMDRTAPAIMPNSEPTVKEILLDAAREKAIDSVGKEAEKQAKPYLKDMFSQGATKFKDMFGMGQAVAAPASTQMAGLISQAGTSGLSPAAAQAVLGSGSSAAPLVGAASGQTAAGLTGLGAKGLAAKAAAGTAGTGAMAGMAAAIPYIGMGLLAGKAFGLFNQGGVVKAMQEESKELLGPLAIRRIRYKQDGGKNVKFN